MAKQLNFFQKILRKAIPSELDEIKVQLDKVNDKLEDEQEHEIRALVKSFDSADAMSGGANEITSIGDDIDSAQLQSLFQTETWFYVVVSTIAKTIAALPPTIQKRSKVEKTSFNETSGAFETVQQEDWVDASAEPEMAIFKKPNNISTPVEFYWLFLLDLLVCGEAFIYIDTDNINLSGMSNSEQRLQAAINRRRGRVPNGMYRINAALMEVNKGTDGKLIESYTIQSDSGVHTFCPDEIVHIKIPNPADPLHGLSPIIAAIKNLLIDRYTKEHFIRFYKQGARLGGVIKTEQKLTKEQLTRLERTFENNYTGKANHHRTLVLPQGMDYKTIEANPGESSLLDFTKQNMAPILAVYDVPPVKIGNLDGASYANANVQLKIYYTDTIMPYLRLVEEAFNSHPKLINPIRPIRFKFDLSGIEALREDQEMLGKVAMDMVNSGATVNEIRYKIWKLPPITGGDKSKVIELMKKGSEGFGLFQHAAPRGLEKTPGATAQQDNLAISDIEPTTGSFPDRVAQLCAAAVNQGVPFQQALDEAIKQALLEGFMPSPTEVGDATAPKPPAAKVENRPEPSEELIHGRWSKSQIVNHWTKVAGDGTKPLMTRREAEVRKFFKRLEKLYVGKVKFYSEVLGKGYKVKAGEDDDLDPDAKELDDFIDEETANGSSAMEAAMKVGYDAVQMKLPMKYPDERAKAKLLEISTRNVKSVVGTTRDQLKTLLDNAYSEGKSMGEIKTMIHEKFSEISEGRAKTIVRTEVLTAVSAGQRVAVDEFKSEYPDESRGLMKAWISAQDDKVRDDHAVFDAMGPVEDDFEYVDGLKFPRDPDCDDAGEVINCRCTEIYFMQDEASDLINVMSDTSLLPNEGNNYNEGPEKSLPKGGAGSGGAREGAGRKPGHHGVTQAANGQITMKRPTTVDEASAQLDEMKRILAKEQAANDAENPKVEGIRLAHAKRQMSRAMSNARAVIAKYKR